MSLIPIMRPILPKAAQLLPYLDRIDFSRIYSNYGPLALEFEGRLAARYGLGASSVTTVANGTLGLALALMAQDAKPGTLCLLPAWTFIASAEAVQIAGLTPYFVDVDLDSWALTPAKVDQLIRDAPGEVGAVMTVVPFGRPIDFAAWDRFRLKSGLSVVVDAAAAFDSVMATGTPTVVSLHATKVLGVGEGGFVLSTDPELVHKIHVRANFGFSGTREATTTAINAKLSEYHAAVGLAALDEWPEARKQWQIAAETYRSVLSGTESVSLQHGFGEDWVTSVCVLNLNRPDVHKVEESLHTHGVESRRWWSNGAHAHNATSHLPHAPVPNTELLTLSTLGVPLYRDITRAEVERVVAGLLAD